MTANSSSRASVSGAGADEETLDRKVSGTVPTLGRRSDEQASKKTGDPTSGQPFGNSAFGNSAFGNSAFGNNTLGDNARGHNAFGLDPLLDSFSRPRPEYRTPVARLADLILLVVALLPVGLLCGVPLAALLGFQSRLGWLGFATSGLWCLGFALTQLRLWEFWPDRRLPRPTRSPRPRRVAVIGAGPVGLATVKECAALGLSVHAFEARPGLGGVFRFDQNLPSGVWESVRLTSSPWVTAFSDHPPSSPSCKHWMHDEYLDYLRSYAERFDLLPLIRTGHRVNRVERLPSGEWELVHTDDETGKEQTERFDAVAVCTGTHLNHRPFPEVPGLDTFDGELRDIASYKSCNDFRGKRVVIVGLGESGADVAAEISRVAAHTMVSIRRGKLVIPRINPLNGLANDYDTNRVRYATPLGVRNWYMTVKRRLCLWAGDLDAAAAVRAHITLQSTVGPMSQTATKSDDFVRQIIDGALEVRAGINRFEGGEVVFDDQSRDRADVVVFAHGFTPKFDFVDLGAAECRHPGDLYLNMFHPEVDDSIAFLGFARPNIGAIPPTGELQARLFANVAAGLVALPKREAMAEDIERVRHQRLEEFPAIEQPSVVVQWIPYMDRLATAIGCRPSPWRMLFAPRLLWKTMTGPMTTAQYRLHGSGSDPRAREAIEALPRSHHSGELFTLMGLHMLLWPLTLLSKNSRLRTSNRFI